MQRRSFFKQLFGAVVGGLAAPREWHWAPESVVVIEPPGLYVPMVGGRYAADQPMFPMEGGFYRAGDTFEIVGPGGPPPRGDPRYRTYKVVEITE